jgi:regulator of replication initiation timing
MNRISASLVNMAIVTLAMVNYTTPSQGQQAEVSSQGETQQSNFEKHLDELTSKLDSMRQQLIASQNEMDELRTELSSLRQQLAQKDASEEARKNADSLRASIAEIQDETEVMQAEVKQHDQIKVETVSKYPLRVTGTALFTSVLNSGNTDDANLPMIALPKMENSTHGTLSATASQTVLGLDASGPHLWGAGTFADLSIDFWGGVPSGNYGGSGLLRFRTGHARLVWPNRSISMALDRPMISPWQPVSWITVGEPALAWSGNLWTWSPQLQFKQDNLMGSRYLNLALGLIDPQAPGNYTTTQSSGTNATERSRRPGYEARLGTKFEINDRPVEIGASGYYSRQSYPYKERIDAWAGAADWNMNLNKAIEFSGELYRGRAIGGLGGGTFKDYVSFAPYGAVRGLNAAGGWAQAKVTFTSSLTAHVSGGLDNSFAKDLRGSYQSTAEGQYARLARNQTLIGNIVYRPKSYLIFTTEFRQIRSKSATGENALDSVVGLGTGYIF